MKMHGRLHDHFQVFVSFVKLEAKVGTLGERSELYNVLHHFSSCLLHFTDYEVALKHWILAVFWGTPKALDAIVVIEQGV